MSVLSENSQQKVLDSLIKDKVITPDQLAEARVKASKLRVPLFRELVGDKYVDTEQLTKYIAHANKVPYVNLKEAYISEAALDLLPKDLAQLYMAVPLGEMDKHIIVAMLDPDNIQAIDFLANKIGRPIKVYAASEDGIKSVLSQYKIQIVASSVSEETTDKNEKSKEEKTKIESAIQDSPISKTLQTILEYATNNRASDVHLEPTEKDLRVRVRVDGVLIEIMRLPKSAEPALVSRVKILANLKIDEHRIPQDGEFSFTFGTRSVDLRIAISPVVWGEQIVIRILEKSGTRLKLEDMGYSGKTLRTVRQGMASSAGMVLTSGPTGSGKSTSLYAILQEVKSSQVNIVTLEDPVEYKMEGINQIQINPDVGLTFATGLRSVLRQDPDIIMVGEIRDKETAELAVQSALTGHLVFSTLHTNSAAGILPRLLDMGIEPFLIASTIKVVIGQRLVRRLGEHTEDYQSTKAEAVTINDTVGSILPKNLDEVEKLGKELGYLNLPLTGQNAYTLKRGVDSPGSPGGYKGRTGIYEAFEVTPAIQDLILERVSSNKIEEIARSEGMITMRQDGYLKALTGITTIKEVNRVASEDF